MSKVNKLKLNNGKEIPVLGLGTWNSLPGEVTRAVKSAIDVGYRHIDCAFIYGNEKEVGAAISEKIKEGVVKREDLFITSKLWNTFHRKDLVEKSLKVTLENLGLTYLDLYLIHWPMGYLEDGELVPKNSDGVTQYSKSDFIDTWKELENLVKLGLVKSIGLSNFNSEQIQQILNVAQVIPANNQVECHPYLNQSKLIEFCQSKGITVTAYSPLGSPARPAIVRTNQWEDLVVLEDPVVLELAKRYGKSPAQILIRFQIERDVIVIPKSVTSSRIQSNFEVFDFELTKEDMGQLLALDKGTKGRLLTLSPIADHKDYPFKIDF